MTRILLAGMSALAILSASSNPPQADDGVVPSPPTVQVSVDSSHLLAMCPMSVTGTQVVAGDAVNGGTLTFTTTGAIAELRTRAERMQRNGCDLVGQARR